MALVNISTLLPRISPYVRSCPEPVILQVLQDAARQFVLDSGVWIEELAEIESVANQADYTVALDATYSATVLTILSLKIDDVLWAESKYTYEPDGVLTLDPAYTVSNKHIVITASLLPNADCATYPDWLMARWGDGMVAGALMRLKEMAGVPWFDERGAQTNMMRHEAALNRAKVEPFTGRKLGPLTVEIPQFV